MRYLKLYEAYKDWAENTAHLGFVKTEEEAIQFLKNNNINPDYCEIYKRSNGNIAIEIQYNKWVVDDIENWDSWFDEFVESEITYWHESGEGWEDARDQAYDQVYDSDVEDAMEEQYPELCPPEEYDFDTQEEYEKEYESWTENTKKEYEEKYNEVKIEDFVDPLVDEIYDDLRREKEDEMLDHRDQYISDHVYDDWSTNEQGRGKIHIENYAPNPEGFLPVELVMVDDGTSKMDVDTETEFNIYNLISTEGLLYYEGSAKFSIISDSLITAGDLNTYYLENLEDAPILSKAGLPGEGPDVGEGGYEYFASGVGIIDANLDEDVAIENFLDNISPYPPQTLLYMLRELEAKEPDVYKKIEAKGVVDDITKQVDRINRADKYKGVIKF